MPSRQVSGGRSAASVFDTPRSSSQAHGDAAARLLIQGGMRAGEVLGLTVDDVDIQRGLAVVRRGKGRVVPFGPQVARSVDRYVRMRLDHTGWPTPRLSGSVEAVSEDTPLVQFA